MHGEALSNVDSLRGTLAARRRRGSSPPATPPDRSTRRRASTAGKSALDGSAAAYGADGDRRRQRHAARHDEGCGGEPLAFDVRRPARATSICAGCRANLERAAGRDRRQRRRIAPPARCRSAELAAPTVACEADADVPADRRSPARRSPAAARPASTMNGEAIALSGRRHRREPRSAADRPASSTCRRSPTDRYKSDINGHVVANGRGTTPKRWT